MEHRIPKLESEMLEVKKDIVDIKTRIAVAESNIKDIKADLSSIKSNTTWIIRLIVGAIVLALLGFISQGGI
jgi:archaellum component FlaC